MRFVIVLPNFRQALPITTQRLIVRRTSETRTSENQPAELNGFQFEGHLYQCPPLSIMCEFAEGRLPCPCWFLDDDFESKEEKSHTDQGLLNGGQSPNAGTPANPTSSDRHGNPAVAGTPMQRAKQHETRFSRVPRTRAGVVFSVGTRGPNSARGHGASNGLGKAAGTACFDKRSARAGRLRAALH